MIMGAFNYLTVLLVAAKLLDLIDWSWWLVFAPTLLLTAISVMVIAVAFIATNRRK